MKYLEINELEINDSDVKFETEEKPILKNGTIVYCKGHEGTSSFYGIVYEDGILELKNGSNAYIQTKDYLHLGDRINYWTIEKACKAKLIIENYIE